MQIFREPQNLTRSIQPTWIAELPTLTLALGLTIYQYPEQTAEHVTYFVKSVGSAMVLSRIWDAKPACFFPANDNDNDTNNLRTMATTPQALPQG